LNFDIYSNFTPFSSPHVKFVSPNIFLALVKKLND